MIADQITVLNEDYAPSGLQFVLQGTTRTINWNWFNEVGPNTTYQTDMKQQVKIFDTMHVCTKLRRHLQLRQGDVTDFNVYTVG